MKEKIKAVIFDLDGVIVHTDKFHYLAWKKLADRLGIYFDEKINNRCRGVSRLDSLDIILEKSDRFFSAEEKLEFAQEKNLAYQEFLLTMTKDDVTKEVRETLEFLKSHGVKVAIGSSSKNAKLILQQVELLNSFDAISDGNNISKSKPNPEVFLKAAEMLNIEPKFCAIVEDAVAGIQAGKAAQMRAIAIGDAVESRLADYNIENFEEIKSIVTSDDQ